jgi:hypothetical protein
MPFFEQAEESASDFSSEPSSSSFVVEDRRLPSAEEMMERCAVSTACSPSSSDPEDEDNDDVPFFDARESECMCSSTSNLKLPN